MAKDHERIKNKILSDIGELFKNKASSKAVLPALFFPLIKLTFANPDAFNILKHLKFLISISREKLRPDYGDGFQGAPLHFN